jgi:hypothetical protein
LRFIPRILNRRIVLVILGLFLAIPLVCWLALRTSLVIDVHKAEVLKSQVKALLVRESTFQDAQRLAMHYGGKVDYRGEPCTPEKCDYAIVLGPRWTEEPDRI